MHELDAISQGLGQEKSEQLLIAEPNIGVGGQEPRTESIIAGDLKVGQYITDDGVVYVIDKITIVEPTQTSLPKVSLTVRNTQSKLVEKKDMYFTDQVKLVLNHFELI